MKRAHQKREVHTSTAQLLLCIASVDDDAAAAAEERKARSSAVTMASAGGCREDLGLRLPNAMTAPAKGACEAGEWGSCWSGEIKEAELAGAGDERRNWNCAAGRPGGGKKAQPSPRGPETVGLE